MGTQFEKRLKWQRQMLLWLFVPSGKRSEHQLRRFLPSLSCNRRILSLQQNNLFRHFHKRKIGNLPSFAKCSP
jgi:hypothetical protein